MGKTRKLVKQLRRELKYINDRLMDRLDQMNTFVIPHARPSKELEEVCVGIKSVQYDDNNIVRQADLEQLHDTMQESIEWLRLSKSDPLAKGDEVYSAEAGLWQPVSPSLVGHLVLSLRVRRPSGYRCILPTEKLLLGDECCVVMGTPSEWEWVPIVNLAEAEVRLCDTGYDFGRRKVDGNYDHTS